ncbi:dopamine beta-hydroxylase isoform X2 [Lingula anatina]|uniref:Dopamine beta-hydroxylase isoform X2 n=1 Tax=Lingula anatina TaxID=7574 RepID=A0A1S3GZS4_LINAN|nr:dopamine beta-hydroxylase isoform X2 [Lingula anatina]|eukprot:XP_013379177.1 dopamine beta-hydroxylase isoform X2 [Lingula anatina]
MAIRMACFAATFATIITISSAYPHYGNKLPNGQNVPHPCKENTKWLALGHVKLAGGQPNNQFGLDFKAANYQWTPELCRKDSDQDGKTNGEELGDPNCAWQENSASAVLRTENITHPGICEPVDSAHCRRVQNFTYECQGEYNCTATKESHVKTFDLRFPETSVPAVETTYICNVFKVPTDKRYHAVAFEPIIGNIMVLHHMTVYGCSKKPQRMGPHQCNMVRECQQLLTVWSTGMEGYCLSKNTGVPFGNGSYEYLAVEIHWNNPELRSDYTDNSGMRMFYTDQLRPFSEGTAAFGQYALEIPPGVDSLTMSGVCQSKCTEEKFNQDINVTAVLMHMHYQGIAGKLEQWRDGKLLRVVADDPFYTYETPNLHTFDPPIVFKKGDEFRTYCTFTSKRGKKQRHANTTYFGLGTQDEMCFALISYHPLQSNNPDCVQFDNYDSCGGHAFGNCDLGKYYRVLDNVKKNGEFQKVCDIQDGRHCSRKCHEIVEPVMNDPCMQGKLRKIIPSFDPVFKPAEVLRSVSACEKGIYDLADHVQYISAAPNLQSSLMAPAFLVLARFM